MMLNTEKVPLRDASSYPPVKKLPAAQALRILVTGGSGFVGTQYVHTYWPVHFHLKLYLTA